MTAKKEDRGVRRDIPKKMPLACNTIAYTVLKHLHESGVSKPADLYQMMPKGRKNTTTVFAYVERLTNLEYAHINHHDEISITPDGRAFIENKPAAPTPEFVGIPAAPRDFSVWTPPLSGYESSMRAHWRFA